MVALSSCIDRDLEGFLPWRWHSCRQCRRASPCHMPSLRARARMHGDAALFDVVRRSCGNTCGRTATMSIDILMIIVSVATSPGSAPLSWTNSFMAAEPLFRSAATRTVETTEQKNERWMEGDCHSKLKIENLGPRRARSGRSRCLEDLRKFLECCRRSEAPPAAQR